MVKISPQMRAEIFRQLLTTPEREALYKEVSPLLEKILGSEEASQAWLFGSFATSKPRPGDIDVWLKLLSPREVTSPLIGKVLKSPQVTERLHVVASTRDPWESQLGTEAQRVGRSRYGEGFRWLRILSLLGGAGLGALALEGEGEAARLPIKSAPLPEGLSLSSATEKLKGIVIRGKAVAKVLVGKGPWRHVVFEDGTHMTMDKGRLSMLVREVGRTKYAQAFEKGVPPATWIEDVRKKYPHLANVPDEKIAELITRAKGGPEKVRESMALRALRTAEERTELPMSALARKSMRGVTREKVREVDEALLTPVVAVRFKGKTFWLTKPYAEFLQKTFPNLIKIVGEEK